MTYDMVKQEAQRRVIEDVEAGLKAPRVVYQKDNGNLGICLLDDFDDDVFRYPLCIVWENGVEAI